MIPFHRDLLAGGGGCREDFHGCFGAQPLSSAVVSALALPVMFYPPNRAHTLTVCPYCISLHMFCVGILTVEGQ